MRGAVTGSRKNLGLHPLWPAHGCFPSIPESLGPRVEAHPPIYAWVDPLCARLLANAEPLVCGRLSRFVSRASEIGPDHAHHRQPLAHVHMLARAVALAIE